MDPGAVAWGWPLAALAAGLALGALIVWRMRRAAPAAAAPAGESVPLEVRDLDGRLDVLILQLREMQELAAKRSPAQLARERYALELEAAAVLRQRDERAAALSPARKAKGLAAAASVDAPVATGFLAARPALRGFVLGGGTVAAVALLVFYVGRTARPRDEGGSVTGNLPPRASSPMGSDASAPMDSDEAQARAALERNPDDFESRLDLAQLKLRDRDLMAVWNETQYVLERQPGHPRALSYQALVRLAMGQPDIALRMLKQALARDPDLFEGYLHLALVETRLGHDKEAQAAIDEASRRFPERAEVLAGVLPQIREQAAQQPPAPEGDPHAAIPPPETATAGNAKPAPPPPAPAGEGVIEGVIELPPALAGRVRQGAIVFVTVRESGAEGGPPVAVKRIPASSFPLRFSIGPGDSMMGQPLPARSRLEARVDSDGDAMTRDASDPSARQDDVAAGSTRLRLVLR